TFPRLPRRQPRFAAHGSRGTERREAVRVWFLRPVAHQPIQPGRARAVSDEPVTPIQPETPGASGSSCGYDLTRAVVRASRGQNRAPWLPADVRHLRILLGSGILPDRRALRR